MDFLLMLLWFSPCWLPVAAVALLAIIAILRQAKHDAQAHLSTKHNDRDDEASTSPPPQP